jgi:signal transduction histidine kinase
VILLFFQFLANSAGKENSNILLINSYHQGYAWTDSLTSGIIKSLKKYPEVNLHIKYLNTKKFGQTKFNLEKEYLKAKYENVPFSGVIVSDNDALDFAIKYAPELFPQIPIVYVGIPNPEEYALEGSNFYGIKETGDSEQVLALIRQLLPNSRSLFVIADNTTTGLLNKKEYTESARLLDNFQVVFPRTIDLDSIYKKVASNEGFDAIFYAGINQDERGQLIDPVSVIQRISVMAKVPVFTNDPQKSCPGILGGLFRYGEHHGSVAVDLLNALIYSKSRDTIKHINTTTKNFFFDKNMLDKYSISTQRLPTNSRVFNKKKLFSRENFLILTAILVFLSLIIVVLMFVNQKVKREQRKSENQLKEIERQKNELESANTKLAAAMSDLESINLKLNDLNEKLVLAKSKAEESDRLKSAFLANVSHEIRTPLNSIVGFSSLLTDDRLDCLTRNTYIDLIESNTESLLVLIDEIIDLSKIEAQQLSLNKQDFSIDKLIGELYQTFSLNQKNHNVQLIAKCGPESSELFVFSDRVRVKQIFINLLTNAFKFTDFGIVEFGYLLSEEGEYVLYVKDTGIGIQKEYHQAIFQRFRKLNEAKDKRIYRGTGLGLAITQKLVELLGGRIWIDSQPGVGSVFYFTLPAIDRRDKQAQKKPAEAGSEYSD